MKRIGKKGEQRMVRSGAVPALADGEDEDGRPTASTGGFATTVAEPATTGTEFADGHDDDG